MFMLLAALILVIALYVYFYFPGLGILISLPGLVLSYLTLPLMFLCLNRNRLWRPLPGRVLLFWGFVFEVFRLPKSFLVHLNNRVTTLIRVSPQEAIVLVAKCLQSSSCSQNLASGIDACQHCGRCPVMAISVVSQAKNVRAYVEPGGSSARARILLAKPALVFAVACPRELLAGMADSNAPVVAIGIKVGSIPCQDSQVAVDELSLLLDKVLEEG